MQVVFVYISSHFRAVHSTNVRRSLKRKNITNKFSTLQCVAGRLRLF